ncbi:P-loop NTPase family protein [Xanthobacter agilis]|uniref:ABC-type lipoprotein export system ATPase subunit n=1 Tax=Xanthobacter agilis TaxID=47492 RepID=A0ABU0LGI8_XANAG|nr:hypothetical protein [Xanthobacter agilis]MDQ0506234.1 ABC-type lipoprotein export system ATPase subunit [Xanthobacter agilis]
MLPADPTDQPYRRLKERAMGLLGEFGVEHRAGFPVEMVSGGEVQRIAIVRAHQRPAGGHRRGCQGCAIA